MSRWGVAQVAAGVAGLACAAVASALDMPSLFPTGMALFALALGLAGAEGVVTRRMEVPSRAYRYRTEAYTGIGAVASGLLYMAMGAFFMFLAYLIAVDGGGGTLRYFARRPGVVLLFFAAVCAAGAVAAAAGTLEDRTGPKWIVTLTLMTSRLLPAAIAAAIAVLTAALGLYEMTAPEQFDAMGGGFLEMLFGADQP